MKKNERLYFFGLSGVEPILEPNFFFDIFSVLTQHLGIEVLFLG